MAADSQSQVKSVFNRCLLNCPSVPLWTAYLSFIKKVHDKLMKQYNMRTIARLLRALH